MEEEEEGEEGWQRWLCHEEGNTDAAKGCSMQGTCGPPARQEGKKDRLWSCCWCAAGAGNKMREVGRYRHIWLSSHRSPWRRASHGCAGAWRGCAPPCPWSRRTAHRDRPSLPSPFGLALTLSPGSWPSCCTAPTTILSPASAAFPQTREHQNIRGPCGNQGDAAMLALCKPTPQAPPPPESGQGHRAVGGVPSETKPPSSKSGFLATHLG